MDIRKYVNKLTDKELIAEFMSLENNIFNIECYGTKDIILLHCIGAELEKRGYVSEDMKTYTKWRKEKR